MCTLKCPGICTPSLKKNSCELKAGLPNEQLSAIAKREEFALENKTWEKSLNLFKDINNSLKNKLSIAVDAKDEKAFLVLAEYFQNQFVLKDEFIADLKKDLNEQEKKIKEIYIQGNLSTKILKRQDKLRNEMSSFEKNFTSLQNEFNKSIT